MSVGRQFSAGLRWMAAAKLVAQVISWAGTLVVLRLLAPSDYGLAALSSSVLSVVAMVAELGLGAGLVQARTLTRRQLRSVFGAALLFALLGVAAIVLAAPGLAIFFREAQVAPLMQVASLHLLLAALSTVPDAMLRRSMSFKSVSIIELGSGVVASLVTLALAWRGAGVWSLVIGPLAGAALRSVLLHAVSEERLWPSLRLSPAREQIGFGANVSLARIVSALLQQADVLIGGRQLSKAALGEYSVSFQFATLPVSKFMGVLNLVAYPAIAQLSRDGADLRPHLLHGLRLLGHTLLPVLWGMAAVAPSLVHVVLGHSWQGAVLPLQLVCLAAPFRLVATLLSTVVQGSGRADLDLRNTVTTAVILPLCFLIGVQWGAVGLAAAWLVGLPIALGFNLQRAQPLLRLRSWELARALRLPATASAVMAFIVASLGHMLAGWVDNVVGLTCLVFAGATSQLALLWLLDRDSLRDLLAMIHMRRAIEPKPGAPGQ
jgi:teichuronic acid exporter